MSYPCEALGCATTMARDGFMCMPHWSLVPSLLQERIYDAYHPVHPSSAAYRQLTAWAIVVVAEREGVPIPATLYRRMLGTEEATP